MTKACPREAKFTLGEEVPDPSVSWAQQAHRFEFDLSAIEDEHPYTAAGLLAHDTTFQARFLGPGNWFVPEGSYTRNQLVALLNTGLLGRLDAGYHIWPNLHRVLMTRIADRFGISPGQLEGKYFFGAGNIDQKAGMIPHSEGLDIGIVHLDGDKDYIVNAEARGASLRKWTGASATYDSLASGRSYALDEKQIDLAMHADTEQDGRREVISTHHYQPEQTLPNDGGVRLVDGRMAPGQGVWMPAGTIHRTRYNQGLSISFHFAVRSNHMAQHICELLAPDMAVRHRTIQRHRYPAAPAKVDEKSDTLAWIDRIRTYLDECWDEFVGFVDGTKSSPLWWKHGTCRFVREGADEDVSHWSVRQALAGVDYPGGPAVVKYITLPREADLVMAALAESGSFIFVEDLQSKTSIDFESIQEILNLLHVSGLFEEMGPWVRSLL